MDTCCLCFKSHLIPNQLKCGHFICETCIKVNQLTACTKCAHPLNIKFEFEMSLTESPTVVVIKSQNGSDLTYNATILLHGRKYNEFLAKRREKEWRVIDNAETRLEYDEFLKWKEQKKIKK